MLLIREILLRVQVLAVAVELCVDDLGLAGGLDPLHVLLLLHVPLLLVGVLQTAYPAASVDPVDRVRSDCSLSLIDSHIVLCREGLLHVQSRIDLLDLQPLL